MVRRWFETWGSWLIWKWYPHHSLGNTEENYEI